MDFRNYPYSFPLVGEQNVYHDRTFPGGGFGPPGFPPGGQPGGFQPGFPPGSQPGQPPGGHQQAGGPPTTPPPSIIPQQQAITGFAVDPGAIRRCINHFTYIWLHNGRSFWLFPEFVGRHSIAGWRWRGNRWVYYGTELRNIRSFQCR